MKIIYTEPTLQYMFANGLQDEVTELMAIGEHCQVGDKFPYLKIEQNEDVTEGRIEDTPVSSLEDR